MNITWYGTASVAIDDGETRILFDPFLRLNRRMEKITVDDYKGADAIFVTHGHCDHIMHIPALAKADPKPKIYATSVPVNTLKQYGVPENRLQTIAHGDEIKVGKFTLRVYKSRHIDYDFKYNASVAHKCVLMAPKALWLTYYTIKMPMSEQIVTYEIENDGKRVVLMGSFGVEPGVDYPMNPDVFVLPFGGCTIVPQLAEPFVAKIKPKKIFITHFDNAFPPLTRTMDTQKLVDYIGSRNPEIEFITPTEKRSVTI